MLYVLYYLRGHYAESFVYFSHLVSSCLYHACDQVFFQDNCNHHHHYPARALRALGLLLADGAPIVGGGKTF